MNSSESQIIDLKLAFRQAENVARKRSAKAWIMANLLVSGSIRGYLFLCYAYLRWVDNFVDDKSKSFAGKKDFIEKQLELIITICGRKAASLRCNEEAYLYYFISFTLQNEKPVLIDELNKMMNALRMDVYRLGTGGIFSQDKLKHYISLLNESMFGLVHSFIFPNDNYDNKYENLGEFLWYAGTLRDFLKDLDSGYVNISEEDIKQYKININNQVGDENLKRWLRDKVPFVLTLLGNEIAILKSMPFKVRFFWAFAYPFYLQKILRIKMYDYSYDYNQHIIILKEIKASVTAFFTGTRTILKILFK